MNKKTLVVGGSTNPDRYSNKAILKLRSYGYEVVSTGLREGIVGDVRIQKGNPPFEDIDTITLYVGPARQPPLYDYLLGLNPRRIIFNPGTENKTLEKRAQEQGIETVEHCTLIMIDYGMY